MLVIFGVLLMIVFTVGGILDSWFQNSNPNRAAKRQVATTSFGNFTNYDMEDWSDANRRVAEFTFELFQLAGGQDKAKAVPISLLNTSTVEARDRDILSRMAHARFAEEKGMYVGEETMEDYFNMLCNNELGNQGKTVEQFSRELQRGSLADVKAHLRTELLAIYGRRLMVAGIAQGSATPTEIWEAHRRIREKFQIEYYVIDVAPASSIEDTPTMEQMKELFAEGEDQSPEFAIGPGFKTPRMATVGYFAINRKTFLEEEKKKITEAQIQAKYNEWVENEDFRVIDNSSPALPSGGDFELPGTKKDESEKQDPEAAGLNSPENSQPEKGQPENGSKNEATKDPVADAADAPAKAAEKSDKPAAKTDAPKETPPKKEQSGQQLKAQQEFQFVSLPSPQQEPKKEPVTNAKETNSALEKQDSAKQDSPKQAPAKDGATPPQENPKPAKQNSAPPTEGSEPEKPSTGEGQTPAEKNGSPDSLPPVSIPPLNQEKDKPKIKPLDDEMRDTIREELARPASDAAIKTTIEAAREMLEIYLSEYDEYLQYPEEFADFEAPDFEAFAKENGLSFAMFEQIDFRTLEKSDFGKAGLPPTPNRQNPGTVATDVFFVSFERGSTFEIKQTSPVDDVEYLYWVTDRENSERVTFKDAQPRIIEYFRQQKAVAAAEARAEDIITNLDKENMRLSAKFPGAEQVTLSREFGWLEISEAIEDMAANNPQMAAQFQQFLAPKPGSIVKEGAEDAKPLEGVDVDFMSRIFALEENEAGFSVNATKDKVYVFQVVKRKKLDPNQKDKFFTQIRFGTAGQTAQLDQREELREVVNGKSVLDRYSVKWFGEPENK
ncbi:MAG: hypothetical protein VX768_16845 [Planctomycetota bacterium]|nr:hypothetical protein [Planctomycetota bacterium]